MWAHLKEAIELNVPIALSNKAPCHESMSGLDVMARWEMLTPNEFSVPKPKNVDSIHRPPTKRDATINRKYGFRETFVRVLCTGTAKKMAFVGHKPVEDTAEEGELSYLARSSHDVGWSKKGHWTKHRLPQAIRP